MLTIFALFAIVAIPILFFMLTWVVVTACRIFYPEKPLLIERSEAAVRRRVTRKGASVPVGVREIREDQRNYQRRSPQESYHYEHGDSEGLPLCWYEELHHRRN